MKIKKTKLTAMDLKGIGALVRDPKKKDRKQVGAKVIKFPGKDNRGQVEKAMKMLADKKHSLMKKPLKDWTSADHKFWNKIQEKVAVQSNPSWVLDHDKWTQARKDALKSRDEDHPQYWGLVTHIYKKAGGRIQPGVSEQVGANAVRFVNQMEKGIAIENEHRETLEVLVEKARQNMDPVIIVEEAIKSIATDHLREIPDYYDRLAKMEKEAGIHAQVGGSVSAIAFVNNYPAYVKFLEAMSIKHYAPVFERLRSIDPHDLVRPETYFASDHAARGYVLSLFQDEAKKMGLLK